MLWDMSTGNDLEPRGERSPAEKRRLAAIGVLGTIVGVFAVLNLDEVNVQLLFADPRLPLVVVIVACLAIGFAAGRLADRRRRRHER
jgi:uncharacterized integral membrane protein